MTKNEIQLWWKLMAEKAHVRYLYCKLRLNFSNDERLVEQHNHAADLWMRIENWRICG